MGIARFMQPDIRRRHDKPITSTKAVRVQNELAFRLSKVDLHPNSIELAWHGWEAKVVFIEDGREELLLAVVKRVSQLIGVLGNITVLDIRGHSSTNELGDRYHKITTVLKLHK